MTYKEEYEYLQKQYFEGTMESEEYLQKLSITEVNGAKFAINELISRFGLPELDYDSKIEEAGDDIVKLYVLGRKILKKGVARMCSMFGFKVEEPFMPGDGIQIKCSLLGVAELLNKELDIRIKHIDFLGDMKPLGDFYFKIHPDYIPYAGYISFEQKGTEE